MQKEVAPGDAPVLAGKKLASLVGRDVSDQQAAKIGSVVYWALGELRDGGCRAREGGCPAAGGRDSDGGYGLGGGRGRDERVLHAPASGLPAR